MKLPAASGRGIKNHNKESGPRGLCFIYPQGDLLYLKFIDLLKPQITNPQKQTNNNSAVVAKWLLWRTLLIEIQNPKQKKQSL